MHPEATEATDSELLMLVSTPGDSWGFDVIEDYKDALF